MEKILDVSLLILDPNPLMFQLMILILPLKSLATIKPVPTNFCYLCVCVYKIKTYNITCESTSLCFRTASLFKSKIVARRTSAYITQKIKDKVYIISRSKPYKSNNKDTYYPIKKKKLTKIHTRLCENKSE